MDIASLIEGGCYSAVFAVLLFAALKNSAKREGRYCAIIADLAETLKSLDLVDEKLKKLIDACERMDKKLSKRRKEGVCACKTLEISAAEASSVG